MLNYDYINNDKKETIVLLHGFGGNANCFKRQIDHLNNFFNILLIDMHGHGRSSHMHLIPEEKFTLRKIAFDINTLLENLYINKAHFMGLSLGTIVANVYACHYPSKVQSLINIGAITKLKPIDHKLMKFTYNFRRFIPYMMVYYVAGFIIMPLKRHRKARKIFVTQAKKMNHSDFFTWAKLMMSFENIYPSYKLDFSFPTLYISGAYDHVFIKEVEKHCNLCKNSRLHILKNAGHICNYDDPLAFNMVMVDFYESITEVSYEEDDLSIRCSI